MVQIKRAMAAIAMGAAALAGCEDRGGSNEAVVETNTVEAAPALPEPEPVLGREQLILAATRALSAAALGVDDRQAQRELKGRRFELRMRFGCGEGGSDPSRRWTYDEEKGEIRVHIGADLNAEDVPASDLLNQPYEGLVGFTLGKSWLLNAGCPTGDFAALGGVAPTIAIAQLFTAEDSRVQRPEPTYDFVRPLKPEEAPREGLDLVVSGRLQLLADGRPIHCAAKDGAPACLIAARIDRVALDDPARKAVLSEWRPA